MSEFENNLIPDEELEEVTGGAKYGDGSLQLVTHTVVRGDALYKLANRYNTTTRKIQARNPIITNRNFIREGWVLQIMANDR